jgi:hypothetical protein
VGFPSRTNRIDGVLFDDFDMAGADFVVADTNNFRVGDDQGVTRRAVLWRRRLRIQQKKEDRRKRNQKTAAGTHGKDCIEEHNEKREQIAPSAPKNADWQVKRE